MIHDLVLKNRSFRRFYESEPVPEKLLVELIDTARFCSSGRNAQPLRYLISSASGGNGKIFPHLRWAGYLKDWDGPGTGEKPAAYIVVCHDTNLQGTIECDAGIAIQSILFGLVEKGFGACIIGSIDKPALKNALKLDTYLDILYVLAIGKPKETVVLEEMDPSGDIKYWRDKNGIHHVPKRPLSEILIFGRH